MDHFPGVGRGRGQRSNLFSARASVIPGVGSAGEFAACTRQRQLAAATAAARVHGRRNHDLAQTRSHWEAGLPV